MTGNQRPNPVQLCEPLRPTEAVKKVWTEGPTTWWTSAIYSLGVAFRQMLGVSRRTPLNFMSDHGIHFGKNNFLQEVNRFRSSPQLYLSWFEGQIEWAKSHQSLGKTQVLACPHPYPYLRMRMNLRYLPREGCVGFIPHSLGGNLDVLALEHLLLEWSELPHHLQPKAVCLSHHEMSLVTHNYLKARNLEVFSAGNPNSPWFASRFYQIISRFEYLTSPVFGSQFCFGTEAGMKCFLFGSWPNMDKLLGDDAHTIFKEMTGGDRQLDESLWLEVNEIFSKPNFDNNERERTSDYLLGKQFSGSLGEVREAVLEAGKFGKGAWLRVGAELGRSVTVKRLARSD